MMICNWIKRIELCENALNKNLLLLLLLFSHLFQILYELEKNQVWLLVLSLPNLALVQEMACLYHACNIWPRKHSYPNLIPILLVEEQTAAITVQVMSNLGHDVAKSDHILLVKFSVNIVMLTVW